jgi:hypothetical protein
MGQRTRGTTGNEKSDRLANKEESNILKNLTYKAQQYDTGQLTQDSPTTDSCHEDQAPVTPVNPNN